MQLDILKTDVYSEPAHPTYLYFNPHIDRPVWIEVVSDHCVQGQLRDLFDVVKNKFVAIGVTCTAMDAYASPLDNLNDADNDTVPAVLKIDADSAVLLALPETGANVVYLPNGKTTIGGRVVRYPD